MIETHALDTPINRADIAQLPLDDLEAYIIRLRERRLASYNIYLMGVELKKKNNAEKATVELDKLLSQFVKVHEQAMNALTKLEKYAHEIQVRRIIEGDYSVGES